MIEEKDKDRTGRQLGGIFVLRAVQLLAGFAVSVLVARLLGPEGKGVLGVLFAFIGTMSVLFSFGLSNSIIYHASRGLYTRPRVLAGSVFWAAVCSLAYVPAAWLLFRLGGDTFLRGVHHSYFAAASAILPLFLLNMIAGSLAKSLDRLYEASLAVFVKEMVFAAGVFLALLAGGKGVGWIIVARLAADTAGFFALARIIRGAVSVRDYLPSFDRPLLGDMLSFGGRSYASFSLQLHNNRADIFLLNYFASTSAVGVYSVGLSLAEAALLLPSVISFVLLPKVAARGGEEGAAYAVSLSRRTFWSMLVFGAALAAAGRPLIALVFGPEFAGAYAPLCLLYPGVLALSVTYVVASFMEGTGRPGELVRAYSVSLAAGIGLNLLLVPRLGFNGTALAYTVSSVLSLVLLVRVFSSVSGRRAAELFAFRPSDFSPAEAARRLGLRRRAQTEVRG